MTFELFEKHIPMKNKLNAFRKTNIFSCYGSCAHGFQFISLQRAHHKRLGCAEFFLLSFRLNGPDHFKEPTISARG